MRNEELFNILIIFGIFLIFIGASLIFIEFYGAVSFCNNQDGDYSFSFKEFQHYCNREAISIYSNGWEFEKFRPNLREINVSVLP